MVVIIDRGFHVMMVRRVGTDGPHRRCRRGTNQAAHHELCRASVVLMVDAHGLINVPIQNGFAEEGEGWG